MPTYTVRTANLALAEAQKERIAAAITAAHNAHTGAPAYFAQIIFDPLDAGSHFLGARRTRTPCVRAWPDPVGPGCRGQGEP